MLILVTMLSGTARGMAAPPNSRRGPPQDPSLSCSVLFHGSRMHSWLCSPFACIRLWRRQAYRRIALVGTDHRYHRRSLTVAGVFLKNQAWRRVAGIAGSFLLGVILLTVCVLGLLLLALRGPQPPALSKLQSKFPQRRSQLELMAAVLAPPQVRPPKSIEGSKEKGNSPQRSLHPPLQNTF